MSFWVKSGKSKISASFPFGIAILLVGLGLGLIGVILARKFF